MQKRVKACIEFFKIVPNGLKTLMQTFFNVIKKACTRLCTFVNSFVYFGEKVDASTVSSKRKIVHIEIVSI